MHYLLFHDVRPDPKTFREMIPTVPAHMFNVVKQLPTHINKAHWYVAHIYRVKNGDTLYSDWNADELRWRFLRNVHPCNHFYVPKSVGAKLGEHPRVIAYFAALYQKRYAKVWSEFLDLCDLEPEDLTNLGAFPVQYGEENLPPVSSTTVTKMTPSATQQVEGIMPAVMYASAGLVFKRKLIEPLAMDQSIRIVTPFGTFRMTKEEFHHTFDNVVASNAYVKGDIYS